MTLHSLPRRRLLAAVLVPLAAVAVFAGPASAHAIIVSSKPAQDSKVPQGPVDILLQFNSRIDIKHSRVSLVDAAAKVRVLEVSDGPAPGSLVARGIADSTGRWIIRWQVLSTDGHITRGEIPFQVIASAP